MHTSRLLLTALGAVGLLAAQAPTTVTTDQPTNEPTGFLAKTLTVGADEHRYVVYVPPGYTQAKPWPLLVFLNGMGECGTDGKKHVEVGLGPAIQKDPQRWPFVVVFPQKPDKQSQWIDHDAMVMAMLAATEKDYAIDGKRRFLTGLSQGGAGTWALGARHKDVWAAIAPVCGYGKPAEVAAGLKDMPIWAFHGLDDKTVPAQQSKDLVAAVEAAGGAPVLTLYEKTAHNSWDQAYRESGLAEWFRLVGDDPVGARYLARPEALDCVEITITRRRPAAGGGGPGQQKVEIAAKDVGFSLGAKPLGDDVAAFRHESGSHATSWRDDGPGASRWVSEPLRRLQRGGLFFRPAAQPPADDVPGHRVDLVLDGKAGQWRFQGFVPAADPGADSLRAAIDAIVESVLAELRH